MLDVRDPQQLIDEAWQRLGCRIVLPEEWSDFFEYCGCTSTAIIERRGFARYYLRGKAILHHDGKEFCVYTKDMSRSGFCFLHYRQLFPCETVSLFLATGSLIEGEIVRCKRIGDDCFECGAAVRQG